jgi:polyisoprenoid-binding protein YceI
VALSKNTLLCILTGWLGSLSACAAALADTHSQTEILQLDAARSNATFSVKVLWMLDVEGVFGSVQGQVSIDRAQDRAQVGARIDANAVAMRRPGTENWVKSAEFFHVADYPEIVFESAPFPLARLRTGGELPGMLNLRGIRAPMSFRLLPSNCDRPAIDCPVQAEGSLKRSQFGMRSRKGTLSDKVELVLSIRAHEAVAQSSAP